MALYIFFKYLLFFVTDDIEDDMDLNLFLSATDSCQSSEDSQCDQEDILEDEMLDDTVTEDIQVEVDSEKDGQHLIIKWHLCFLHGKHDLFFLDIFLKLMHFVSWLEEFQRLCIILISTVR